jgi:hypothetical protein
MKTNFHSEQLNCSKFKVQSSRSRATLAIRFSSLFPILLGLISIFHFPFSATAQTLKGVVHGHSDEGHVALVGANVIWSGTTVGTVTDVDGRFSLAVNEGLPAMLVVSYVGYTSDTITIHF